MIDQLDVIILKRGAGVSAPAIHRTDDDGVRWRWCGAIVRTFRTRSALQIGGSVPCAARAVGTAPARLIRAVTTTIFINLWLTGIQKRKEFGIVGVARVIDDCVAKITCRNCRSIWEGSSTTGVECDRVRAVLKKTVSDYKVNTWYRSIPKYKIAVGIGRPS